MNYPYRHNRAALPHTNDRVVSLIGYVKISPTIGVIERGIAGTIGIARLHYRWDHVNRLVQEFRMHMAYCRDVEDYSIVREVDRCNTCHRECCDLDEGAGIDQNNQNW